MTSRRMIALTCDGCGLPAPRHFELLADVRAWMQANGWREAQYGGDVAQHDRCPACQARYEHEPTNGA